MGNPTSYLGKTLTWEGKKLVAYTDGGNTISYAYNEDGLRLEKTVNGVNTEYYYNGSILIAMADGTNTQKFSYDSTGNVVSVNFNGTEYYYLRNAQGDIVKLIDKNKNAVVEYTYDSWGKPVAVTGTLATTLGANQPFRYRGYVYDNETGWYYLQSRYYDPTTCRFISADVLLSTGQGILGHNSFAYCLNNPVNKLDDGGCAATLAGNNRIYLPDYSYVPKEEPTVLIGGLDPKSDEYRKLRKLFIDDYSSTTSHYLVIAEVKYIGRYEHKNSFLDKCVTTGGASSVVGTTFSALSFIPKLAGTAAASGLSAIGMVFGLVSVASMIANDGLPVEKSYDYYQITIKAYISNEYTSGYALYQNVSHTFFWNDAIDNQHYWCTER